jgi:UDP-glucose 4-epimerase
VLDDLSKGHRDAVPAGARFVQGRIHDAASVIDGAGFEAVIHLAAFSLVGESVEHPDRYEENNVLGTARLCDAMRTLGVNKIIVSSTAAVYGEPDVAIITEETKTAPVNPYGSSKLAVDDDLALRTHAGEFAAISLRYFNVAGAYGSYGERHGKETHLIPNALAVALGERASLTIFGDDFPTPDGTCVRDYIHVLDIANAHVLALAALEIGHREPR